MKPETSHDRWLNALRLGREALEAEDGPKKPLGWAVPVIVLKEKQQEGE